MNRTSKLVAAGAGVVVLIGAAVAITLAIARPSDAKPKTAAAKTMTVSGALHLHGAPYRWPADESGKSCDGGIAGGLEDMQPGTQVVIYDASGKIVGSGGLLEGTIDSQAGSDGTCRMPFTIESVPAGAGPYSVEVGHRGKVVFNEADASNVDVTLG